MGDGVGHRIKVGRPVLGHVHDTGSQPEQVGSLVEGRMGAGRQHDLRLVDAALGPGPLPGRLHRTQDALGPAAGHEACRALRAVEQVSCPGAEFGLNSAQ